jgi:hypothetical protein
MAKIKLSVALPVLIVLAIAIISYFFFLPKDSYRNDCNKPLTGFDALFVYSVGCPHCKADLLRMENLNLTERFYMVDSGSTECGKIIDQYSDYIIQHKNSNTPDAQSGLAIPTKVCLRDNKTYIGEMPEDQLRGFYENCTGVQK